MKTMVTRVTALALAALTGCVAPPPPALPQQQAQVPLIAVPGPGRTQAQFNTDDAACRAEAGQAPMPPRTATGAVAPPANGADPAGPAVLPPGMVYLRCMEARTNVVQPLPTAAPPVLYATYAPYPIYAAYGPYGFYGYDPFFGGPFGYGYGFGFGIGFGFGFGGYGRYYGGYGRFGGYERFGGYGRFGGGYGGGFREGGYGRGGGYGGGGYGGGFREGGYGRGGGYGGGGYGGGGFGHGGGFGGGGRR